MKIKAIIDLFLQEENERIPKYKYHTSKDTKRLI